MNNEILCPECRGAQCARCERLGVIIAGDPATPLSWFLHAQPTTWAQLAGDLYTLAAEASAIGRDLEVLDGRSSRTIAAVIDAGRDHLPDTTTRWLARRGAIYRIPGVDWPGVVEQFGEKLEGYEQAAKPIFRIQDQTVTLDRLTETTTPRATRLAPVESTQIPGLFVERRGTVLTFKSGAYWETWDVRTGQQVGAADTGVFPAAISAYIRERLAELLPAHRQPAKSEAAPVSAETAPEKTVNLNPAPIVGAPATPVKQQEGPMAIDLSNPAVVAAARTTAVAIINTHGIPAIESRRNELRQDLAAAEEAYRLADVAVEKAKRDVSALEAALKERDQELLLAVSTEPAEGEGKKKLTDTAAKASAVAARKTDAEYIAIKTSFAKAKGDLDAVEQALAKAKARQRALIYEKDLLIAEMGLASARIQAFAGLDSPAPAAASTPTAAAQAAPRAA